MTKGAGEHTDPNPELGRKPVGQILQLVFRQCIDAEANRKTWSRLARGRVLACFARPSFPSSISCVHVFQLPKSAIRCQLPRRASLISQAQG